MTLNLRDSKLSQTERQVNALIMSCLFTHPTSFLVETNPQKGSACAEAWKHWHEAYIYTKPNYSP